MVNLVEGVDLDDPAAAAERLVVGTRVTVVFDPADEREARVTDFDYGLVELRPP